LNVCDSFGQIKKWYNVTMQRRSYGEHPELFVQSLQAMQSGEALIAVGGNFPGRNASEDVSLDVRRFIPMRFIVTRSYQHPPRMNPNLAEDDDSVVTVPLERLDTRLGHDYGDGPAISFGPRAGLILGNVVDLIIENPGASDAFYFVGKI
jgi:hypothetical protein